MNNNIIVRYGEPFTIQSTAPPSCSITMHSDFISNVKNEKIVKNEKNNKKIETIIADIIRKTLERKM